MGWLDWLLTLIIVAFGACVAWPLWSPLLPRVRQRRRREYEQYGIENRFWEAYRALDYHDEARQWLNKHWELSNREW
jgi:hypothetical protein